MPDGSETPSIHNGRDLWAPTGTPVVAGGKGRVVMARDRMVTGKTVILEHLPGVYTLYYHLDSLLVEEGVVVRAGQEIGTVGSSGLVTGEHLHWELRTGGIPIDPWQYRDRPLLDTTGFSDIMVGSLQEGR
jgi:murein DD-endopeptidase MepM/ murein hydrolase activator NlpD